MRRGGSASVRSASSRSPAARSTRRVVTRHQVRDALERLILDGTHKPGTRLVQEQFARRFNVARSVVREALLELQSSGLVESVDNRGVYVGRLDAARLIEAFEVREALEALAVRLCCERTTREELRGLEAMAERIRDLGRQRRPTEMASTDRAFHDELLRLSGNRMLVSLSSSWRVFGKVIRVGRDPEQVFREHMGILRAIGANQPERAERLARAHIRVAREIVARRARSGRFVPEWVS